TAQARVIRMIESGACADATLALLELELPQWRLRRLIREDDEWHCSISKQLGLPAELDDMAEASHESLPLAILSPLVEAQRRLHAITTNQSPKAAARRHLCGNCNPGCDHAGVRGASCRSALDGSCPRLASRSDLRSVRPDRPQRPAGLL